MHAKLGKTLLDALGWTMVGEAPTVRKFVLERSLLVKSLLKVKLNFLLKKNS